MAKATEFNIFGSKISIIKRNGLKTLAHEYGHYDGENSQIVVDSSLTEKEFVTTLMHEVIHATFDRLNIQINPTIEEMLCEVITISIYDNFKVSIKD